MPGGPCGPGGPGGPWGPLGPGGPAFLPGKHKDRRHLGLWGGLGAARNGRLGMDHSWLQAGRRRSLRTAGVGVPQLHTTRTMLPTGQDRVTTLQAPSRWELHLNEARGHSRASQGLEAQGVSSHSSGHSSGHSALSTGSVLKSHGLELVTSLQIWDDLWIQSGCSQSAFQCTQARLECYSPDEPLHGYSDCWVLMENRDNPSYLLHPRIRR